MRANDAVVARFACAVLSSRPRPCASVLDTRWRVTLGWFVRVALCVRQLFAVHEEISRLH